MVRVAEVSTEPAVVDQLLENGWTSLHWSPDRSLSELSSLLFVSQSGRETHKIGVTSNLIAKTKTDAKPGTKSSIRGLNSFPLHTDQASLPLPPRYIFLRSIYGKSASPTYVFCFREHLIDTELLYSLSAGLWACRGSRSPHICSVWENGRVKWDEDCMRPLDRIAKHAHQNFCSFLMSAPKTYHTWPDCSSVLLIDNWTTMHGRASVTVGEYRKLERLYLELS